MIETEGLRAALKFFRSKRGGLIDLPDSASIHQPRNEVNPIDRVCRK